MKALDEGDKKTVILD
ncbi:TPA: hypothetical protein ACOFEN_003315 [Bacillus cereus]|nr:hypothetical protein [Bacillus cereus]MCQ6293781.1 hypothetical protein [Bacillus cereus]MCT1381293.1 hypothetical protein [Bacillus sp. p3-SID196]